MPATRATRQPAALSARYCSNADLPAPDSPRRTNTRLSPPRTLSSNSPRVCVSRRRPRSATSRLTLGNASDEAARDEWTLTETTARTVAAEFERRDRLRSLVGCELL